MPGPRDIAAAFAQAAAGRGLLALCALALCALALVGLGGCAELGGAPPAGADGPIRAVAPTPEARADVNQPRRPMGLPDGRLPDLRDLQEMRAPPRASGRGGAEAQEADRLRMSAMRDNALSYGAQGGTAFVSRDINRMLERQAPQLDRVWDFNRLLIRSAGGMPVLPPVISEGRDTFESSNAGRTIRAADRFYEIVEQSRFTPAAPIWQEYLVRRFEPPRTPPADTLPREEAERDLWRRWVSEGWAEGERQAREIFRLDLARLERDFVGMVRFKELLERNQVSAPVVASQPLGVTGTGQSMRVGDTVQQITRDPRFNVPGGRDWRAVPGTMDPVSAATPPGDAPGVRDRSAYAVGAKSKLRNYFRRSPY